jgi:hypothetical protein
MTALFQSSSLQQSLDWYRLRARVAWLHASDRVQRRAVTGQVPVVVSLTTHGSRIAKVHTCIESIVAGSVRPGRLILWLNHEPDSEQLPVELKRLQRRGLEIRYTPNYGPHTKYFPYVAEFGSDGVPLVTADDDVIYAKDWLEGLLAAHQSQPGLIHCYLAREVTMEAGLLAPYRSWKTTETFAPSLRNFALGVAGVIYPPEFVLALREAGDAFMASCPKADDIWLHAVAVRNGFLINPLKSRNQCPLQIPFTQDIALFHTNFLASGNDAQIRATYSGHDLRSLAPQGQLGL